MLIVRLSTRVIGACGVLLGLVLILGGHERFQAPSFATARSVPGQYLTWGALAGAAGAAVLIASIRRAWTALVWAQSALGVWCLFFAGGVLIAAVRDPRAALTGFVTYTAVGLVLIIQAVGLRTGRTT